MYRGTALDRCIGIHICMYELDKYQPSTDTTHFHMWYMHRAIDASKSTSNLVQLRAYVYMNIYTRISII